MENTKPYAKFLQRAKSLGAKHAKIIPARSIVTAQWVRLKCQFGCGTYGTRLTCPPNSPTPEQTQKLVECYKNALMIHGDEYTDIHEVISALEREMFLDGYYKAFGMAAGPCGLCKRCPKTCAYPEKARPAMEACGIDVFATARANGFPIEVVRTENCKGNYYGVVLIE